MPPKTRTKPRHDPKIKPNRRGSQKVVISLDSDEEDGDASEFVSDNSEGDILPAKRRPQAMPVLKRSISSISSKTLKFRTPTPSQRNIDTSQCSFLVSQSISSPKTVISQLWVEKYAPKLVSEVAIHPKKLQVVEQVLTQMVNRQSNRRILLLTGPSGSSKSTLVKVLLNSMVRPQTLLSFALNAEESRYIEYTNPELEETSHVGNFSSFLEAARYSTLPILVEELPNVYHEPTRAAFVQSLAEWLHTSAQLPPLVLCLTETELPPESDSPGRNFLSIDTSLTAETLLGPQILNHQKCVRIKFNPIAKTILLKPLKRIIQSESALGGLVVKRSEAEEVLRRLGESGLGDIRSAISALEFWASNKGNSALNSGIDLISLTREDHLGLFHAIGKIVYGSTSSSNGGKETEEVQNYNLRTLLETKTGKIYDSAAIEVLDETPPPYETSFHPDYYAVKHVLDKSNSPSVLLLSVLENYAAVLAHEERAPGDGILLQHAAFVAEHLSAADTLASEEAVDVALRGTREGLRVNSKVLSLREHTLRFSRFFKVMKQRNATRRELMKERETRKLAVSVDDLNMLTGFYEPLIVNSKRYKLKNAVQGYKSRLGGRFTAILLDSTLPYGDTMEEEIPERTDVAVEYSESEMSDPIVDSEEDFDDSLDEGFEYLLSQSGTQLRDSKEHKHEVSEGEVPKFHLSEPPAKTPGKVDVWDVTGDLSSDSDLDSYF
ncbi:hypothetical protein BABINDRAFT_9031 [Babjeviella inositovora NRRL Y-12698]|uniref:Checkpoint protein RAD24-like helical bundle domain-containing protein n=1 Tax=Babjeviella inositovora NRRL Y-12698 TaxID=984486 RepID=A0A1E3QP83_9ASCO|nr:uncharacterized protein BABINDRAFT_9031 [Babjeviella inositovora NRRL Y-12698]ODQ78797.1 hypothetical protein BABINDRAFT_9031 [Babjeviella inositovora NRRL Y-12698]